MCDYFSDVFFVILTTLFRFLKPNFCLLVLGRHRMPSTRSQGPAQPTLSFPRRKSYRVSSRSKTPQQEKSSVSSPTKHEPQHLPVALTRIGPLSQRRPADQPSPLSPRRLVDRLTPLSPKPPVNSPSPLSPRRPAAQPLPPSSPSLQTRIPLSPRKRTGKRPPIRKMQKDTGYVICKRKC